MNKEIRFRWAQEPGDTSLTDAGAHNASKTWYGEKKYIQDRYSQGTLGNNAPVDNNQGTSVDPDNYCILDFQIIAEDITGTSNSLGKPGSYVALDVIPKGTKIGNSTTGYDIVVMVWYDETSKKLKYTYNKVDLAGVSGSDFEGSGKTNQHWENPADIFEGAGQYCQIKADPKGGVHIAAYDSNSGDVRYAKLDTYSGTAKTCLVDSSGIVGSNLTLDVALDAENGFAIPYISYYGSVGPKMAYLTEAGKARASSTGKSIADAPGTISDMFTGYWEVTEIPSSYNVPKDRINVGVWKTKKTDSSIGGVRTTSTATYSGTSTAVAKGNGTDNPVVAYEIRPTSATGYMETAQKK